MQGFLNKYELKNYLEFDIFFKKSVRSLRLLKLSGVKITDPFAKGDPWGRYHF